jgi:hypothetical protein
MDNQTDDMIPEWQAKKQAEPTAPPLAQRSPLEPAAPVYGMSPYTEVPAGPPPRSGPGIAAFIMGLIGILTSIGSYALIFSAILSHLDEFKAAEDAQSFFDSHANVLGTVGIGGLGILLAGLVMFVGLILGIVGLVQKNRRKGFALAGTIMNGIFVFIPVLLLVFGLVRTSVGG